MGLALGLGGLLLGGAVLGGIGLVAGAAVGWLGGWADAGLGPARRGLWTGVLTGIALLVIARGAVAVPATTDPLKAEARCVARLHVVRAQEYEEKKEWLNAKPQYFEALKCDESNVAALRGLALGLLAHEEGKSERAIELLEKAARLAPDSAVDLSNLASAYIQAGRPGDALPLLDTAVRLDPREPNALFNRARALEDLGRRAEAIAAWEAFVARAERLPDIGRRPAPRAPEPARAARRDRSPMTAPAASARSTSALLGPVAAALLLSGTGSLVMEVCWSRLLKLVFGSTTLAISTILVAYMLGLGIGGLLGGRVARRLKNGIATYGWMELAIAVYALAVPFVVGLFPSLNSALLSGMSFWPAALVRFVLALAVFLLPDRPDGSDAARCWSRPSRAAGTTWRAASGCSTGSTPSARCWGRSARRSCSSRRWASSGRTPSGPRWTPRRGWWRCSCWRRGWTVRRP